VNANFNVRGRFHTIAELHAAKTWLGRWWISRSIKKLKKESKLVWDNTTLIRNLTRYTTHNTEDKKFDISTDTILSYIVSANTLEIYEDGKYETDIPVSNRLYNIISSYFHTGIAVNKKLDAMAHVDKFNELSKQHLKGDNGKD
jgi:hypothetical protein